MDNKYEFIERIPSNEEFLRLRKAVGWGGTAPATYAKGLENSLYSICALYDNEVVGFGRVIGDGGIYYYVQDVIVLPEFQGRGIGTEIMTCIIKYLETNASERSFIGLMAAKGNHTFYKRFGFTERAHDAPGMQLIIGDKA